MGTFPVYGLQGFAREGMQGLIIEKGPCPGGYGGKGKGGAIGPDLG